MLYYTVGREWKMKTKNKCIYKLLIIFLLSGVSLLTLHTKGQADTFKMNTTAEKEKEFSSLEEIPPATLASLAQKKIYFGHHSVGGNIIQGMKELMVTYPDIRLNIVETFNGADFEKGVFAHSAVGRNREPKSKIDEFSENIDKGIGGKAEIAGFKLCYADILWDTDIDEVLVEYSQAMTALKKNYPDLTIIHFTTPLSQQKMSWKRMVKKILRMNDPWRYGSNIKRNEYNNKLTETYQNTDIIFDIATIESTYPDGTRSSFEVDGKTYYSLVPEYTSDGGHLNEVGRKLLAEQFILLLASLD